MSKITVQDVAGLMVKGARSVVDLADGELIKAIKDKGEAQAIAFPETAFYLPLANALLGSEARNLSDAKKIVRMK